VALGFAMVALGVFQSVCSRVVVGFCIIRAWCVLEWL